MILTVDAGEQWQYPIFGLALLHHKNQRIVQLVSQVQRGKFGGQHCYAICYGGVQWWIGVASHRNLELEKISLRKSGEFQLATVPWNEIGLIQSASRLLRDAHIKVPNLG
jgi:hypothetical protein